MSEAVNNPSHYGGNTTYEAIKVIEAHNLGFHLGNVVKYVLRAGKKSNELEDLKKAMWYLSKKIDLLEPAPPVSTMADLMTWDQALSVLKDGKIVSNLEWGMSEWIKLVDGKYYDEIGKIIPNIMAIDEGNSSYYIFTPPCK